MTPLEIALIVFAYLLGSVSTAIVLCRLTGLPDPRSQGSRNPGATNVLRFGGKKAAAVTLVGDLLKGVIPVLVAAALGVSDAALAAVALAAFLGHLFPVFFGFKGGKGVATALGVLLGLHWPLGLAVLGTWLVMAGVFRISSLSALTAAVLAPVYAWLLVPAPEFVAATGVMALLLIWRHRANIRNLLTGNEAKIGKRQPAERR